MDYKKEAKFLISSYVTNGFTIWFYLLYGTTFFRYVPAICGFRVSLWADSLVWIFFVPIICQAVFPFLNKIKFVDHGRGQWSKDSILSRFAFTFSGIIVLGYVLFISSILLIIPEDNPQTRIHPDTFNDLELKMYVLGHALAIISPFQDRIQQYYRDKNIIQETERKFFNLENKISIICLLFSLAMSIFAIHDIPLEKQGYFQNFTCSYR